MRIALIGAGSAFGGWALYTLVQHPELYGSTIILIDINEERLKLINRLAEILNEHYNAKLEIVSSTQLDVLEDTSYDYAIISVEKERYRRWRLDYLIPEKYGIQQVLAENGSIGGLSHTLRVVPLVLDIAKKLEDVNEYGRVFIYSNPEPRVTYAVSHGTSLRYVYGLCTGYLERRESLAKLFNVEPEDVRFIAAGLNHFTWIKELWLTDGTDGYRLLDEKLEENKSWEPLLRRLYHIYGLYPSPSDNHVGEYIGWAWKIVPEDIKGLNWIERTEKRGQYIMEIIEGVVKGELSPKDMRWISRNNDIAVEIIYAMETGSKKIQPAYNTVNNGAINGLPDNVVVEIPGIIVRRKIYPVHVSLPRQIIDLLSIQANIQALAAESAMKADLSKAVKALALDPTIHDLEAALKAFKELLTVHADLMPKFTREEIDYIDKLIMN